MALAPTTNAAAAWAPGARLLTVADMAAMPTELPSGPIDYELDNGRLVLMSPTSRLHGEIQSAMAAALRTQGRLQGFGKEFVETGVVLWRAPDRMVGPDVSFVAKRSLPVRDSPEGFLETIPQLVVEIRSKNDTRSEIDQKVTDYLKAGVQLVWVVEPVPQTVAEYRPGTPPRSLGQGETLRCEAIIPGFALPLAELFRQ